jgi:hypothetical protein
MPCLQITSTVISKSVYSFSNPVRLTSSQKSLRAPNALKLRVRARSDVNKNGDISKRDGPVKYLRVDFLF